MFLPMLLIKSQDRNEMQHLRDLVEKQEELRFLNMSGDGRWVSWQSVYETRPSELKVSSVNCKKPLLTIQGAHYWQFIRDHEIVYSNGSETTYRDLHTLKEKSFDDVKTASYVDFLDLLYIHHNEKGQYRLDFYGRNLQLVRTIPDVNRVIKLAKEIIIIRNDGKLNHVLRYDGKALQEIFSSPSEIYSVAASDLKEGGWILTIRERNGFSMFFVDHELKWKQLSVSGKMKFDGLAVHPSSESNALLIDLQTIQVRDKGIVDIWYGKDFDLEDHFRDKKISSRVLWYPGEDRVVGTSDEDYSEIAALGKSGLFLRSVVDHEQVDSNDLNAKETIREYVLYDPKSGTNTAFAKTSKPFVIDDSGRFLLYRDAQNWLLYDVSNRTVRSTGLLENAVPYFSEDNQLIWVEGDKIFRQNLLTLQKSLVSEFSMQEIELVNGTVNKSLLQQHILMQKIDVKKGLLLKLTDRMDQTSSIILLKGRISKIMVDKTADRITDFIFNDLKSYVWFSENFNKSREISSVSGNSKMHQVYSTGLSSGNSKDIRLKELKYKGVMGEELTALLFYPPGFSEEKKYPVVASIYELQSKNRNQYLHPTFKNSRGFNERLFLELGYMVLLPDINNAGDVGPGMAALHCVNAALDELQKIAQADMKRVGLLGQSFGGYEANFIATKSNRFAAYVSGASISDIINTSFAFNYNFFSADYYRYEDGQFKLGKFSDNREKYYGNNPLYFAEDVKSPMLLWTGTADKNVNPEQTRSFYNALRKYRKPVIALFYQDELHSLMGKDQRNDLTVKMIEWFDYYLRYKKYFMD
ncbi:hypothetical protein ASG01_13640 [Chryseobacterium sp. Leaf180]|nr:hypothetical protein ASG01_13640 [Chryseobacterium sp. Leaf180]